jgi:hypothetical protein
MDTGATGHFFKVSHDLNDVTPTSHNTIIQVSLPDGTITTSTHTGTLQIPGLPLSVHQTHIPPNLAFNSLMSTTQLCANGCNALFTDNAVVITLQDTVVLTGTIFTATGVFWTLATLAPTSHPITQPLNTTSPAPSTLCFTPLSRTTPYPT